jgi:hypothetical protein
MPIESLKPGHEDDYPTAVKRFDIRKGGLESAHAAAQDWLGCDPQNHSLNLLATMVDGDPTVFLFPRDQRRATADGKGLVGGFEVAGDFVLSAPQEEATFLGASVAAAHSILAQVRPEV